MIECSLCWETDLVGAQGAMGQWLGLAIDVGPEMTAMIMKWIGVVVYMSTCSVPTEEKLPKLDVKQDMDMYETAIHKCLSET